MNTVLPAIANAIIRPHGVVMATAKAPQNVLECRTIGDTCDDGFWLWVAELILIEGWPADEAKAQQKIVAKASQ